MQGKGDIMANIFYTNSFPYLGYIFALLSVLPHILICSIFKPNYKKVKFSTLDRNEKIIETVKNETVDTPIEIHKKRKFTLDIIELLDGKVNKNIVFFGFWFVISILPFFSVKLSRSGPTSYTVLERLWLVYLFLTGFCYWTYLMIKHRFIL